MIKETELSRKFVDETIREFGSKIWIQLQRDPIRNGTPDIYSLVNGIFIPIESKKVERESGNKILSHPFQRLQKKRMRDILSAQGFPIGLIFHLQEKRYILPLDIREDGDISMEEYQKLPLFTWEEIYRVASEAHSRRPSW